MLVWRKSYFLGGKNVYCLHPLFSHLWEVVWKYIFGSGNMPLFLCIFCINVIFCVLTLLAKIFETDSWRCNITVLIWCSTWNKNVFNYLSFNHWVIKKLHVNQSLYFTCSCIFRGSHCFIDITITYRSDIVFTIHNSLSFSLFFNVNFLSKTSWLEEC